MKHNLVKGIAILGLFFMLAVTSNAQIGSRMSVSIPFDFSAGKTVLKAGNYNIKRATGNLLAITSKDGKTTAMVVAPLTIGSRDSKAGERLVFNAYGNQYFLSQVWLQVDSGRQVFFSKQEGEAAREYKLANNNAAPKRIEIAARGN